MQKMLWALCFLWVFPAIAEEVDLLAPEPVAVIKNTEPVTKESALPLCDDENWHTRVKDVINEYNKQHPEFSLIAKRRRNLQIRLLGSYTEELVKGFTAKKNRLVADKLIMTKINMGLTDNQIRLCKSNSKNLTFEPIYVMMYRDENSDLIMVDVLNYVSDSLETLSFTL